MKLRMWAALIAVYIVWGSTYLAIRFAVESMPPFLMASFRFLLAGAILYTWRRMQGDERPAFRHWRSAAIVGAFLIVGGNGNVVWAEQRVVSGIAALIIGTEPLWIVVIDSLLPGGRRPGFWAIVGVVIGFIGIAVLIGPSQLTGMSGEVDLIGAGALLLAAFLWSVGSLYNRGADLPGSPLLGTSMEMLFGGAMLLVLGTATGEWGRLDLAAIEPRAWLGLVYLIVFGSLVGFVSYTWLLRVAPTPLVSTYAYVNPLVAIFVGNWLAAEPLTPRVLAAAAIIVGAVVLITVTQARSSRQGKPAKAPVYSGGDD